MTDLLLPADPATVALFLAKVSLAVFVSAVLRGFTGFGFALPAVPLLSLLAAPAQAVILSILLQLAIGLIDFRDAAREADRPSLRWLTIGAVAGSPIGIAILAAILPQTARLVIATLTVASVLMLSAARLLPAQKAVVALEGKVVATIVGVIAGLCNGLAAIPGPPAVAYYLASTLVGRAVRASLIAFLAFTSAVGTISAAIAGLIDSSLLLVALSALPAMLAGSAVGSWCFTRGSEQLYRSVSVASMIAVALGSTFEALRHWTL